MAGYLGIIALVAGLGSGGYLGEVSVTGGIVPTELPIGIPVTGGTPGGLLYEDAGELLQALPDVAVGSYLRSGGVGVAPLWSTLTLPNAATQGDLLLATGANVIGSLLDVAVGQVLVSEGVGVAPAYSASPSITGDYGLIDNGLGTTRFIQFTGAATGATVAGNSVQQRGAVGGAGTAGAPGGTGGQWEIYGGTGGAGSAAQLGGAGGSVRLWGGNGGATGGFGAGSAGGIAIDAGTPVGTAHVLIGGLNASEVEIGRAGISTIVRGRLQGAGTSWDFTGSGVAACGGTSGGAIAWIAATSITETATAGLAYRIASSGHRFDVAGTNPFYILSNAVHIQSGCVLNLNNGGSILANGNFASDFNSTGVFKTSSGTNTFRGLGVFEKNVCLSGAVAAGTTAAKVLAFGNGATAPTTTVDLAQIWGRDIAAGRCSLAILTEEPVNAEGIPLVNDFSWQVQINGSTYKIPLVFVSTP